MTQFQVNSILASDRTLIKKKSKQDDFLEHQSILQQALIANPCDDGNANGKPPTPQPLTDFKAFPGLLDTLTNCKENIEGCGTPLTGRSSQEDQRSQQILDEITLCKAAAQNFITGSLSLGSSSHCRLF